MDTAYYLIEAMEALQFNKMNPEALLTLISYQPNKMIVLHDEKKTAWKFISRQQTRNYLLTKSDHMPNYKEIFSMPH